MPDWSYHPIFRPLLFRLLDERARDLTLKALGSIARNPLGPMLIELLGHMRPPHDVERTAWGLRFPTPVGLGTGLDPYAIAVPALARFGVGFVELGPVSEAPTGSAHNIRRYPAAQALWFPDPAPSVDAAMLATRLATVGQLQVPVAVRLAHAPGADPDTATHERRRMIARLGRFADCFIIDISDEDLAWDVAAWRAHLETVADAAAQLEPARPLLACIRPDAQPRLVDRLIPIMLEAGITGITVAGGVRAAGGGWLVGPPARAATLAQVGALHAAWGQQLTIVAGDGIHEPADALEFLAAGASLVQVSSGLVFSGPGLPKRINEAVSAWQAWATGALDRPVRPVSTGWGWRWLALLGIGMVLGGILAWIVGATRVVLPYDEAFVGMSRSELARLNPRLLAFMAHDRITLAGTMIAIGVLYVQLATWGVRLGVHWARRVISVSATAGFASFFLFLGFGYFDPLHALVSALLFPFLLLGIRSSVPVRATIPVPDLHNDLRWHAALWGQLLFVGLAFGLTLAGVTIALIGITRVFVPDDLAFLNTTAAALQTANPRVVALIAHDRAGFGGALVSNGLAVLLFALWGIRRGARWIWWTLLAAGLPGFVAVLSTHAVVGYTAVPHIGPALLAALVYVLGLILLYPYLADRRAASAPYQPEASRFHLRSSKVT